MSDELPKAVWEGEIVLMGVTLKCYVLDDGRRIIDADSVAAFLGAMESGVDPNNWPTAFLKFAKFCRGSGLPNE